MHAHHFTASSIAAALLLAAYAGVRPAGRPASVRRAAAGRLERHAAAHAPARPTTTTCWSRAQGDDASSDLNTAVTPRRQPRLRRQARRVLGLLLRRHAAVSRLQLAQQLRPVAQRVGRRRRLTPHVLLFAQQCVLEDADHGAAGADRRPVPARVGARIADLRGAGSKRRRPSGCRSPASYNFQWIAFDKDPVLGRLAARRPRERRHSRRQVPDHRRTMLHGRLRHPVARRRRRQPVQRAEQRGPARDYRLSEHSHVYGALGHRAALRDRRRPAARPRQSWRAGIASSFEALASTWLRRVRSSRRTAAAARCRTTT